MYLVIVTCICGTKRCEISSTCFHICSGITTYPGVAKFTGDLASFSDGKNADKTTMKILAFACLLAVGKSAI